MRKPIVEIGPKHANETPDAALNRLRRLIETGPFPLHSRLPSERELCAQLKVSRTRLRNMLSAFEAEGLIWRHVGQGTFIGGSPPPANGPSYLESTNISPKELIEARLVVEPAITAYAASMARPNDIEEMRRYAAKREAANDFDGYNFWDQKFHGAIAEASRNPIFTSLYERLNVLRTAPAWRKYRRDRMQDRYRSRSAREHRAIIAAIADRDPTAAFEAMKAHISNVQASFFSWSATQSPATVNPVEQPEPVESVEG